MLKDIIFTPTLMFRGIEITPTPVSTMELGWTQTPIQPTSLGKEAQPGKHVPVIHADLLKFCGQD